MNTYEKVIAALVLAFMCMQFAISIQKSDEIKHLENELEQTQRILDQQQNILNRLDTLTLATEDMFHSVQAIRYEGQH